MLSHFSHVWLWDTVDCSLPVSSVHGILQARVLKCVAMPSSIFLTQGLNLCLLCLLYRQASVGSYSLLQGIFPTEGSNPGILWLWQHNSNLCLYFSHSPPCPSPTPRVYSNSCPLSRWCHPTISSSVVVFSSCFHSFPASGSFQMSQLFSSGVQSIGVSASTSVLPMNTQDWFPWGWTSWISLQSKGQL